MGILGGAIGAGMGLIGTIGGQLIAGHKQRKAKRRIESEQRANQTWYDRRYNEDATQRADTQRLLTDMQTRLRKSTASAAGTAAVMGGSEESVAASKAANADATASAISSLAAAQEQRKDNIESQYLSTKSALNQQLNNIDLGAAAQAQAAGTQLTNTGMGVLADALATKQASTPTTTPTYPDQSSAL